MNINQATDGTDNLSFNLHSFNIIETVPTPFPTKKQSTVEQVGGRVDIHESLKKWGGVERWYGFNKTGLNQKRYDFNVLGIKNIQAYRKFIYILFRVGCRVGKGAEEECISMLMWNSCFAIKHCTAEGFNMPKFLFNEFEREFIVDLKENDLRFGIERDLTLLRIAFKFIRGE